MRSLAMLVTISLMRRGTVLRSAFVVAGVLIAAATAFVAVRYTAPLPVSWRAAPSPTAATPAGVQSVSPSASTSGCGRFAFDKPAPASLRSSRKKAFAYYFPPFPISIDNKPADSDSYAKWQFTGDATGQYDLRDRPIPRAVRAGVTWRQQDFEDEVRQAIAIGLDGFIWEYHGNSADQRWNQLPAMLAAVKAVDPAFAIMLSPDISESIVVDVLKVRDQPALLRVDGAIVLAPFYPERKPVAWWDSVRDSLAAQGVRTAVIPLFLDGQPDTRAADWNNSVIGYSRWGSAWAGSADTLVMGASEAHAHGRIYMSSVLFEDSRAYSGQFWEAGNSATLRATMTKTIESDAEWLYLRTWNDYTESWMAPSQQRGRAVGDVAAYYITWFKTGQRPPLVRDALYYFHRTHLTGLGYDIVKQRKPMRLVQGDPVSDQVELLAFVTGPGKLVIRQGQDVRTQDVPGAGVVSFKTLLRPGTTPEFEWQRTGATAQALRSKWPVQTAIAMQDWIYHADGGTACG
jgi:Glycosyl hydrolase family 71